MRGSLYRIQSADNAANRDLPAGSQWLQFGRELIVVGSGAALSERLNERGLTAQRLSAPPKSTNLYLVRQKGRLFQQEFPKAKVLVDKGRFLVVAMSATAYRRAKSREHVCFVIEPLPTGQVVYDQRAPAIADRQARDPRIVSLLDALNIGLFEESLEFLTDLPTRLSTSQQFSAAAQWARDRLQSWGLTTSVEQIAVGGGTSWNVVAERSGAGEQNRRLFIVTAHLDSINQFGGPQSPAPGADDNGSGSCGVLCLARLFSQQPTRHDLRFILFGGEEQGLFGSKAYLNGLATAERQRLIGLINMDMIGSLNAEPASVLLEGASVSQALIDATAAAAATYTDLAVQTSLNPFASDHVPFIEAGLPAILTIEGADSANNKIHSEHDTIGTVKPSYAMSILRMNAATIAGLAELPANDSRTRTEGTSMNDTSTDSSEGITIRLRPGSNLRDLLTRLGFKFSGKYHYNGGVGLPVGGARTSSRHSPAVLDNPIYDVQSPIYLAPVQAAREDTLRFTLHVDIDGDSPLGVVSGTAAFGASADEPPHFIGKVTSDTPTSGGRELVVEQFRFRWPAANNDITRLEVSVKGSVLDIPVLEVTFIDAATEKRFGPYQAQQSSTFFRDVEIDVDREAGSVPVEPYNTLAHPDRPDNVESESLTLESAFAKAGIRITRSSDNEPDIASAGGPDARWSYRELHDSMQLHWEAFQNRPQWKMWVFLANLGESDGLGGVMFDGDIDEPGGVDRQGTAIFTRCPFFHTEAGGYIVANPPAAAAVKRELFFNLIHETGHAFNLAHSFQKELEGAWVAPPWMPVATDAQALSWMNYPDAATPTGDAGLNASWFYKRFHFRFDAPELLFMRHAPESFVQMGNATWFNNHGRVLESDVDRRLTLRVDSIKPVLEYGEPVLVELRLMNESDQAVYVHENLNLSDGYVEVAITNPDGKRLPFLPISHTRTFVKSVELAPGGKVFIALDLTVGKLGFLFKQPGAYRVEASYTNLDGRKVAAAPHRIYVKPVANWDLLPPIHSLFKASIGRLFYVKGSRVMEESNELLDRVKSSVKSHPLASYIDIVRAMPLADTMRVIDQSGRVEVFEEEPDEVVKRLEPVVSPDNLVAAANSLGNIALNHLTDTFARAAEKTDNKGKQTARNVLKSTWELFTKRKVIPAALASLEARVKALS